MPNFFTDKKMLYLYLAIGITSVLVAIVLAGLWRGWSDNGNRVDQPADLPLGISRQQIPESQLPANFPADIPQEDGAVVTQNYIASTPEGYEQSTRTFETTKSLTENIRIYQDYFTNNNWLVIESKVLPSFQSLLVSNGDLQASVGVNENSVTKVKTVNITISKLLAND